MLELPLVVPQSQKQRSNQGARPVLVPSETGHHAVGGAQVLDLGHLALAGQIWLVGALGDHPVEPCSLEVIEPVLRGGGIFRGGSEMDRWRRLGQDLQEVAPALRERRRAQVLGSIGQAVESHVGGRRLARQHRHAARRRVNAKQQRVEVEPALARDHHLTVQHEARVRLRQGSQRLLQLGEVAVQRLEVARLDVDLLTVAIHQGPEPIPLGLEDPPRCGRDLGGRLGEHRFDGGLYGE